MKPGIAKGLLQKHMSKEVKKYLDPMYGDSPYYYKDLHFYIKYVAYALCKVLGIDGDAKKINVGILMMVLELQEVHSSTSYDYIKHIFNEMHEGFIVTQKNLKDPKEKEPKFLHYSMLMHLLLYFNFVITAINNLAPQRFYQSRTNPIQFWVRVWNYSSRECDYCAFHNWIVYPIVQSLGINRTRVTLNIMQLLRPCYYTNGWDGKHNWGDFFLVENYTIIRVYGCSHPPHLLPYYVPARVATMEFIWQLMLIDNEHFAP